MQSFFYAVSMGMFMIMLLRFSPEAIVLESKHTDRQKTTIETMATQLFQNSDFKD